MANIMEKVDSLVTSMNFKDNMKMDFEKKVF